MQSKSGLLKIIGSALIVTAVVGCSFTGTKQATVQNGPTSFSRYHVVEKGDTLYSIAQKYGTDPAKLARDNRISDPTLLKVGQKIGISGGSSVPNIPSTRSSATTTAKADTEKSTAAAATATTAAATTAAASSASTSSMFAWPASGKVTTQYSSTNKGIDISGTEGEPVYAAADGQVIYVGALRGYGNLIIINHNQTYNTAYGFNKTINVKERETVKKGQQIAVMGKTESGGPKLHFEIRKAGQPVNPTTLLPPR